MACSHLHFGYVVPENVKEKHQENKKNVPKVTSNVRCFKCKKLGHYAIECKNDKDSSGDDKHVTFAMMCSENSEEEKNENGGEENKQESKNPEENERKVDPGTARNTEEPQVTPLMQSYISNVFMTGIMSEWAMSMIEDNLATSRLTSSVQARIESSMHGDDEKSQNMINVQLAREKSTIEHRSSNVSHPGENVARDKPNVSHEEDEIQNSNLNMGRASVQVMILKRMIENQQPKELKRSQKMRLRVGLKMNKKKKPHLSSEKTRKTMKLSS